MERRFFHLMVKPAGARCNLDCGYCYYSDKGARYSGRMSEALLERCLRDYLETTQVPEPSVCWHGGEPLLAGIDFYRKVLEIERRHAGGRRVLNTIQTNGTLLNEEWARFFAGEGFLTGISIDGPRDLHDSLRRDRQGQGSFDAAMRALDYLKKAGAEFNTLSVVHDGSEGHGAEIYRFLRDEAGSRYMQFLPVEGRSFGAKAYGQFLCDVFDVWSHGDIGKVFVQTFDAALAGWCGAQGGLCTMGERCGENLSVESNGDVYACDHFADPSMLLGNLADSDFAALFDDVRRIRFVQAKTQGLPSECRSCEWLKLCNGGCPAQRNFSGMNRLCEGYKAFFAHSAPAMSRMANAIAKE